MSESQFLQYAVAFLVSGGGGAAVAVALFRKFGGAWIENRFAERLAAFKHVQAVEVARLKVEIESLLSGALKLQELEFEVLPKAWRLLDEAFGLARWVTSSVHQYYEVGELSTLELSEVTDRTLPKLRQTEQLKLENSNGPERQKRYEKLIRRRDLNRALKAANDLDRYVASKGIFLPKGLKDQFRKIVPTIRASLIHVDSSLQFEDYKMMRDASADLSSAEALVKQIEADIEVRLQSHARST